MPHVLGMAARQVGHPVTILILMKGDDGAISLSHCCTTVHTSDLAKPVVIPFA
jgi:hypothetical protein